MRARHLLVWLMIAVWIGNIPLSQAKRKDEPDVVVVQHILIGFKKTVPGKKLERTKKEAEALAEKLFERAKAGEDFTSLVREYSDEKYPEENQFPGYILATNKGAPTKQNGFERDELAFYFGDVAFTLAVDEIGLARYHPGNCPFGWHIIKRIE